MLKKVLDYEWHEIQVASSTVPCLEYFLASNLKNRM